MRSKLGKFIIAAIVVLLFVIVTQWTKWQSHNFQVDAETFHAVPDIQTLVQKEAAAVPGLKLANRFHLIHTFDQTLPIPGLGRKLTVEKVWIRSRSGDFYLLYSFGFHESDRTPKDVPMLTFNHVIFTTPKGKTVEADVHPIPIHLGHSYKKRFYRGVEVHTDLANDLKPFNEIETLTLQNPTIITSRGRSSIPIKNISLNVDYSWNKQVLINVPIQKSIPLKNGGVIHLKDLQVRMESYRLNFTVSPRDHLSHIQFGLTVPPYHYSLIRQQQGRTFRDFRRLQGPIPDLVFIAPAQATYLANGVTSSIILQQKPVPVHIDASQQK